MKDVLELREFFTRHNGEDLALCTIVEKSGSGYRGLFAKKLVALKTPRSSGLLSGGCLEKEIEQTAREEAEGFPFIRTFSTAGEDDRLFGYQVGCSGKIGVLFERLPEDPNLLDLYFPFGANAPAKGVRISLKNDSLGAREFADQPSSDSLLEPWTEPVHLSVIGCGADADPYLDVARMLGWSIRFFDYRSEFATTERFGSVVDLLPLNKIASAIPDGPRSAVILMTHSYESDLHLFAELLERKIAYLGLLGPRARYELLKGDLHRLFAKAPSLEWEQAVVRAPPGITAKEHTPSQIAFSIAAEIHLRMKPGE